MRNTVVLVGTLIVLVVLFVIINSNKLSTLNDLKDHRDTYYTPDEDDAPSTDSQ